MPLVLHDPLFPPGEWGLWKIDESETELRQALALFPKEHKQLDCIKGEGRRKEFLAARLLLHHMSGRPQRAELVKDDDGKPHLHDSPFYVSISHTTGYSAAIAHPSPCGIDVQSIVPRIRRLARKFVNDREREYLRGEHELVQLHLIWSAKEAMYKAYGRRKLDFREHLHVDLSAFDTTQQTATAYLEIEGVWMDFEVAFRIFDDFVMVGLTALRLSPELPVPAGVL